MKRISRSKSLSGILLVLATVSVLFMSCKNDGIPGEAGPGTTLTEKLAWLATHATSDSTYTIIVDADYSIEPHHLFYPGRNNITIYLEGNNNTMRTVTLASSGSLFRVGYGVTLILDKYITLKGLPKNALPLLRDPLVTVDAYGTFIMSGGEISVNNDSGTGVDVGAYGTFTMRGGEISGCNSGVSMAAGGTFTMSGGEISGNSNRGVNMLAGGTFIMNGGKISGNNVSGVGVNTNGTFTMNGGEISGNNGSGVSVSVNGTFAMKGGEISGNTSSFGGGVSMLSGGTFIMSGGKISGNTAKYNGGGVHISFYSWGPRCTFNKTGGTIFGYYESTTDRNKASQSSDLPGHAIYVNSDLFLYLYKKNTSEPGDKLSFDGANPPTWSGNWEPL